MDLPFTDGGSLWEEGVLVVAGFDLAIVHLRCLFNI